MLAKGIERAHTGRSRRTGPGRFARSCRRQSLSDEIVDIFAAAGLRRPDMSILSDEFLAEVRRLPHKNLAVEVLRKLLSDEIRMRARKNVVQARSFSEMLERSI